MNRLHVPHLATLLFAAILALSLSVPAASSIAGQTPAPDPPTLLSAAPIPNATGAVAISGSGFTPGGNVYVSVINPWDDEVNESRWLVASEPTDGPTSGQDRAGGTIAAVFGVPQTVVGPTAGQASAGGFVLPDADGGIVGSLCGPHLIARAYDATTREWSNVLDLDLGC